MLYTKKPIQIEAIQYKGNINKFEVSEWVIKNNGAREVIFNNEQEKIHIITLEGEMTASKGDYIIKGVMGEFYPCKPDIFEMNHEGF